MARRKRSAASIARAKANLRIVNSSTFKKTYAAYQKAAASQYAAAEKKAAAFARNRALAAGAKKRR